MKKKKKKLKKQNIKCKINQRKDKNSCNKISI